MCPSVCLRQEVKRFKRLGGRGKVKMGGRVRVKVMV